MSYTKARDLAKSAASHAAQARNNATSNEDRELAEAVNYLAQAVTEIAAQLHRNE